MAPSGTSSSSSTKTAPRAARFVHDVLVVHDLLADVDRRAIEVERLLHRDDRAVDAGAVAAGVGEQDASTNCGHPEFDHGLESTGPVCVGTSR